MNTSPPKNTPNLDQFSEHVLTEINKRLPADDNAYIDPLEFIRNIAVDVVGKEWRDRDPAALDSVIDEIRQERQAQSDDEE